jgi:branched-chain amino acid transport system ATP-binding protein
MNMETSKDEGILRVDQISLAFGNINALTDISFELGKHEFLAIIGPNGAGKTSLLNCINCFYSPQKGNIYFNKNLINNLPRHKLAKLGIARTFQNINLYTHLSTLDNLMAGRDIFMKSGPLAGGLYFGKALKEEIEHREKAEEIIDLLDMQQIRRTKVEFLSYGLRKKVELGRALVMEPRLLLLDEPMAGMNIEEKEDMVRYILDARELKKPAIILVEHDMEVVMSIAERVIVLDFGQKIAEGTPEEVRNDSKTIKAYLGET